MPRGRNGWTAIPSVLSRALHVFFGFGPSCRFVPSCSEYCRVALRRHGAVKGLALAGARLTKCHPWGKSGWDPVPPPVTPLGAIDGQ